MSNKEKYSSLWFKQAQYDLDAAGTSIKGGNHEWACFQAHQSAEKAVKALLFSCNINGWGHNISSLLEKYKEIKYRDISLIEKDAIYLDKQYIPTRYPDALPGIEPHKAYNKEEAESSIKCAENILSFVEEEIKFFKEIEEKENDESD